MSTKRATSESPVSESYIFSVLEKYAANISTTQAEKLFLRVERTFKRCSCWCFLNFGNAIFIFLCVNLNTGDVNIKIPFREAQGGSHSLSTQKNRQSRDTVP
jgi:hypothetical protein